MHYSLDSIYIISSHGFSCFETSQSGYVQLQWVVFFMYKNLLPWDRVYPLFHTTYQRLKNGYENDLKFWLGKKKRLRQLQHHNKPQKLRSLTFCVLRKDGIAMYIVSYLSGSKTGNCKAKYEKLPMQFISDPVYTIYNLSAVVYTLCYL